VSPPILRRSDVAADIGGAAGVEFRAYYETGRSLFCGPGSLTISRHERSRWRGGRFACDTPSIMSFAGVLNRLPPSAANPIGISSVQAKVDSNPIA
jgi:hypothetical protein